MLGTLLHSKRLPIALDLGTDEIKLLQLHRQGGGLAVSAWGRWRFPDPTNLDSKRRGELAVEAVRDICRRGGFRGRSVVSALTCDQLGIKNVRLGALSPKETRRTILFEAAERLGFREGIDTLNCLHAGTVRAGTETRDELILLSASGETVEEHVSLLEAMRLRPVAIDAAPVALHRGLGSFDGADGAERPVTVIVDLGLSSTRVVIARGRQVVFIKRIDIGGRAFNEAVASQLNLSYAEAADLRLKAMVGAGSRSEGDGADAQNVSWHLHDAVRAEAEALAREISLCLRYCSVTFRGMRPDKIALAGGEAHDAILTDLLAQQLGMPCEAARPLDGLKFSAAATGGDGRELGCEWAVCVGLAMYGVDAAKLRNGETNGHGQNRLSA